MQDVQPVEPRPGVELEVTAARRQAVARRLAALVFVAAFLLDVLGDPAALAAVSKLCGL